MTSSTISLWNLPTKHRWLLRGIIEAEKEKNESWDIHYEARSRGRSSPGGPHLGFLSLRNAQTIEPTTARIRCGATADLSNTRKTVVRII